MLDLRVGKISLSGEDSVRFINALFKPTFEEAMQHDKHIEAINENVFVSRSDEGFDVNVTDLDLSFLDDIVPHN